MQFRPRLGRGPNYEIFPLGTFQKSPLSLKEFANDARCLLDVGKVPQGHALPQGKKSK